MRDNDFRMWLLDGGGGYHPSEKAIRNYYIPELLKVEEAEGDLDEICLAQEGLEDLWNLYKYSKEDARAGRANPTNMKMHSALLLSDLRKFRSRINQYKQFCERHPPAPIKAD